jgi:haloacid dehalogenase-like hydrolase
MPPSRMSLLAAFWAAALVALPARAADDPLPSWNDGPTKAAIIRFVGDVTREGGPDFVPIEERIAAVDNDGTLWSEQPYYNQVAFAFDRIKALAAEHPEWKEKPPFRYVLDGDIKSIMAGTTRDRLELLAASHAGMTAEEFDRIVKDWMTTARHPRYQRPYTELVYQPMRELLTYLRASGFTTYIVSGGGVEFMRTWTESVYGIPPDRVIGSTIKLKYELREGRPVLVRLADIDFIDDGAGKPVGIHRHVGRRPIAAFGNSDGDYEMLRWTTSSPGRRFGLIVHHTDAVREWAYDRQSPVGRLSKALDEAPDRGWVVVDMKSDWKKVFAFQE